MESIAQALSTFSAIAWGPWLVFLLLGGGAYFFVYSRFLPFRYLPHAIDLLRGKYDDPNAPGELSHFRALASALAGTIGLGNIGGVAVAIHTGGPGAIFWMWMGAFLGIATKFFTCTLAVLYRGKDSRGDLQGGPMYVIVQGLGERWRPLATFFCLCSLVGVFPLFQANQLIQVIRDVLVEPTGLITDPTSLLYFNLSLGVVTAVVVGLVVVGGIQRIGAATSRLVPLMVLLYCGMAVWILATHIADIPSYFALIFQDAFTGNAVLGGSIGSVIAIGVKRSAFSNEAGIGTEAMAHGAARTKEPVREGLVAMLGPAIDTLIVCTATAIIILSSGVWKTSDANGVTLTAQALSEHLPGIGPYLLVICVFFFGVSTMFSYNYYGVKSLSFIVGAERAHLYNYLYLPSIIVASVVTVSSVVDLIDGMFALMAIPTMTSALLLSPKVMKAARAYFGRFEKEGAV